MSQGYQWGAWQAAQYDNAGTPADWTAQDIADAAELVGEEIDLDGAAAVMLSLKTVEENNLSTDGDVAMYVLRDSGGEWQTTDDAVTREPVAQEQDATHLLVLAVDPAQAGKSIKPAVTNDCGRIVATTVKYRIATMGAA